MNGTSLPITRLQIFWYAFPAGVLLPTNGSPWFVEMIKNDIIQVISKYMEIDPEGLDIQIKQSSEESEGHALYANIPIRELRK